jgi:hypothetical protein
MRFGLAQLFQAPRRASTAQELRTCVFHPTLLVPASANQAVIQESSMVSPGLGLALRSRAQRFGGMDMNKIRRAQLGFAALVLVGGLASVASAQDQPQQPSSPPSSQPATPPADPVATPPADMAQAQADKMASKKIEGELLSVDDATKTLSIRTKDGSEVKVVYNDQTQITGATDQAAGLATAAGSKVKVETTGEGATAVATKITVEAKEKK